MKVDSGGTSTYVRDGADVTDPVLEDGNADYTPGVSLRVGSTTTFDNLNYLASSTMQTNASQSPTALRYVGILLWYDVDLGRFFLRMTREEAVDLSQAMLRLIEFG